MSIGDSSKVNEHRDEGRSWGLRRRSETCAWGDWGGIKAQRFLCWGSLFRGTSSTILWINCFTEWDTWGCDKENQVWLWVRCAGVRWAPVVLLKLSAGKRPWSQHWQVLPVVVQLPEWSGWKLSLKTETDMGINVEFRRKRIFSLCAGLLLKGLAQENEQWKTKRQEGSWNNRERGGNLISTKCVL